MIVHHIALSNIKSYDSLELALRPGVNFIAGRNGAGKTTLIEAVGYTLFGYAPAAPAVDYFLRDGEKRGEMRVTFSHGGEKYTVVRKLGKADTTRVFDETGGELDLHGEKDVRAFMRQQLGMAPGEDMGRLFENVIGIPQGTFTAPFLDIESRRKATFERILRVEEYRQASDALRALIREHLLNQRAALAGRLEGLSTQAQSLEPKLREAEAAEQALVLAGVEAEQALAASRSADETYAQVKQKEEALRDAAQQAVLAEQRTLSALAAVQTAETALAEAQKAGALAQGALAGHEAYTGAAEQLKALEEQRRSRDALERQCLQLQNSIERIAGGLEDWKGKLDTLLSWEAALSGLPRAQADAAALDAAEKRRIEAREQLALARGDIAEEQRVREAARDQRCPYHDMACLQQTDILAHSQERMAQAQARLAAAQSEADAAEAEAQRLQDSRAKLQLLQKTKSDADALSAELAKYPVAVERRLREASVLGADAFAPMPLWAASDKHFADAEAALASMRAALEGMRERLAAYAQLDAQLAAAKAQGEANEAAHLTYLRQSALAATLDEKQKALTTQREAHQALQRAAEDARSHEAGLRGAFDVQAAKAAEKAVLDTRERLSTARALRDERAREAARLRREAEALARLEAQRLEAEASLTRLGEAVDYAKDADSALREMGERMAQRYREYLGARAEGWYRQISGGAAALQWAGDYDIVLTDVHAGRSRTRGFKQLSGGEQMTAALAVRMALLQSFSPVGFACFDEPTTGLDVHRRELLGAALAQVKDVFEQTLIVSHDDTFDALSEHVVHLRRDASGASALEL